MQGRIDNNSIQRMYDFEKSGSSDIIIRVLPPGESLQEIPLIRDIVEKTFCKWNFPGKEGMKTKVIVISDDSEVELLVNGESYGMKRVGKNTSYYAVFEVVYLPGLIEAISYHDKLEFGRAVLK